MTRTTILTQKIVNLTADLSLRHGIMGHKLEFNKENKFILDHFEEKNVFYQCNVLINSGMTAHRTSQQLSLTTPSLTPGSQRFPWEHDAAVWV